MHLTVSIAFLVLVWGSAAKADGPFGVEAGMGLEALPTCRAGSKDPLTYACEKLPRPHPELVRYAVAYHPTVGVCAVRAISADFKDDPRGVSISKFIQNLAAQVAETYGPPTRTIDAIMPNAMWNESGYWMAAVAAKERMFGMTWNRDQGFDGRNRLQSITIIAEARSLGASGFASMEFVFDNFSECESARNRDAAKAFR